ncbi:Bardet-Biedl syndrome 2 [Nymphon striatum]|nr:Bardet-Biedl syndrome 2 [Nymphon striatum]
MLVPVFTLNLGYKILTRRLTVGKFDGEHPCIAAATTADKILIHSPHSKPINANKSGESSSRFSVAQSSSASQDITFLNINQTVTALCCGKLKPNSNQDILVVGTATSVLAYDVFNNSELFYREVPDGANVMSVGKLGSNQNDILIVGGNCSIQGFDHDGNDCFWTVTGDNVCSIAFSDFNGDGKNELIVGSEDFDIRVFQDDEMIGEMSETEAVVGVSDISGGRFAYALANGTVGVYQNSERSWRIKSRNQPISIFSFDLDGDGIPELITGWSNGKIDARSDQSGEVIFKDTFSRSVAAVTAGDYRMDGNLLLICASTDGEVRGYRAAMPSDCRENLLDINIEQETVRELSQRKQSLYLELKNYENNSQADNSQSKMMNSNFTSDNISIIPADTQLQTGLAINLGSEDQPPHVEVAVATTNSTIIKAVIIFAEGIFEGESLVVHPTEAELASSVRVPIYPPKDSPVDLHIKAFVGYKAKSHYHVFEVTRHLPRFAMYAVCLEPLSNENIPTGFVKFTVQDRIPRVVMWINHSFLLMEDIEASNNINVTFLCIRTSSPLIIIMESSGDMMIRVDDIDVAGDLIQSLAQFLNIEDLQVVADFPEEFDNITNLINNVTEIQSARQQLSADMADNSAIIRGYIVRAEDSRLMSDIYQGSECSRVIKGHGGQRWSQLQQFQNELDGNKYKDETLHNSIIGATLDRERSRVVQSVMDCITARLASIHEDPLYLACHIFDHKNWPDRNNRDALLQYGSGDIQVLYDHFSVLFQNTGCDIDIAKSEWKNLKLKNMKKWYMELYNMNKDLINRYNIRCNNHQDLVSNLKQINLTVQKAGRLREDVKINGESIKTIRYADDTAVVATSQLELQKMILRIHEMCTKYGMSINIKKDESNSSKKKERTTHTRHKHTVDGQKLEHVKEYTYLGSK